MYQPYQPLIGNLDPLFHYLRLSSPSSVSGLMDFMSFVTQAHCSYCIILHLSLFYGLSGAVQEDEKRKAKAKAKAAGAAKNAKQKSECFHQCFHQMTYFNSFRTISRFKGEPG